jgi:putative (di)nucleoside polyphosphate hydrolase
MDGFTASPRRSSNAGLPKQPVADCPIMTDVIDPEGFRANVGIILIRSTGHVFLGRRTGGRGWQFPQGGMRYGEDPEQSAYRELHEEVGLSAEHVQLIGSTPSWRRYRLPPRYIRHHQQPLCVGQKQRWFLMRVKQDDVNFNLEASSEPEFDRWRWADYWEPVREVIYFKRPVYASALEELAPLAFPAGAASRPAWWDEVTAAALEAMGKAAAP